MTFCHPIMPFRYHFVTSSILLRYLLDAIFAVIISLSNSNIFTSWQKEHLQLTTYLES